MRIFYYLICCFAATVVVEGALMLLVKKDWKSVYYSFLANLATNPALNAILIALTCFFPVILSRTPYFITLAVLEVIVVFVESRIYKYLNVFEKNKTLLWSVVFNAVSCILGVVFSYCFILLN